MRIDQITHYVSICLIIFTMSCSAQSDTDEYEADEISSTTPELTAEEEIEAEQMRRIFTKQLELNESDSVEFWKIYNAKIVVKQKIIEDNVALKKEKAKDATEDRALEMLQTRLEIKERFMTFEKEFNEALLTVISARQIVILYRMEDAYRMRMGQKRKRQRSQDRITNRRTRPNSPTNTGVPIN